MKLNDLFKLRLEMSRSKLDVFMGTAFTALALYLRLAGIRKFTNVGFGSVGIVDDRLFPNIVAVAAMICALCILALGISDRRRDRKKEAEGEPAARDEISIFIVFIAAIGIFYVLCMEPLGYPLCNIISMIMIYFLLGGKKPLAGVSVACIFTLCSWLFFAKYLGVVLPMGFGL